MTWEHNHNILDGSLTHWQQSTYTTNDILFFSSAKSDANGEFSTNPILNLTFANQHSSVGITLYFVDESPLEVEVTWYNTHEPIVSKAYSVNNRILFIPEAVKLYDEIKIEFTSAIPDRYIKMYFVLFGKSFDWDELTIKNGSLVQEVNMISDKISINKLTFEVIDLDNTLNFGNADNLIEFFVRTQAMFPKIKINEDTINLGRYYLDVVTSDNNVAKFSAFSAIGLLDNVPFNIGTIYNGTQAGVVLSQLFTIAGITEYYIDNNTYAIPLYGTIKPCSCREALQKLLFVTGAIARTNSNEYQIIIEQPSTSLGSKITRADKISTKVSDAEYITGVKLSYTIFEEKSAEEKISEDTYDSGTHTIIFSKPYKNVRLSDANVTIDASNTYYITFTLTSRKTLTLYGIGYEETTNDISVTRTIIKPGAIENIKDFSTNLCDYLRAARLAAQLLNFYISSSLNIEIKNLTSNNSMSGKQIIYNSIEGLSNYVGRYSSRVFDLTGGFIDTAKLIGYYASASADEYYTTHFTNKEDMFTGDYLI